MPLPNYLIIGAAKSGTTSLYEFFRQHPEIFVSEIKEPRFFAREGEEISPDDPVNRRTVTTLDAYRALFDGVTTEKAWGEASGYLAVPKACEAIYRYVPDVRMIAILRDPVERAYSHFLYALQKGLEPAGTTFEQAIESETVRVNGWNRSRPYLGIGFYHRHLTRYLEHFRAEQLMIRLFEDFSADPVGFAQEAYRFVGVNDAFVPDTSMQMEKSGLPKSGVMDALLSRTGVVATAARFVIPRGLGRRLRVRMLNRNLSKPRLSHETRARLIGVYRDDIQRLQELIGRDLSGWLQVERPARAASAAP